MEYTKEPKTYDEQIELLSKRGLFIDDYTLAKNELSNKGYYRLSAYMLVFKPNKHEEKHQYNEFFKEGTKFSDILEIYEFDSKLRLLILKQIEKIEISVRTKLTYYLSLKYGSHWQDKKEIFKRDIHYNIFEEIQNHIQKVLDNRKSETFIKHYKEKYSSPKNPPSWMCTEILYLSQISKIFQFLKNRSDRTEIAKNYNLPEVIFSSWLHTINYVRNICAHYSRLWNKELQIVPKLYRTDRYKWIENQDDSQRGRLYYFLCLLVYILDAIEESNDFRDQLKELLSNQPTFYQQFMGFPRDWLDDIFWK